MNRPRLEPSLQSHWLLWEVTRGDCNRLQAGGNPLDVTAGYVLRGHPFTNHRTERNAREFGISRKTGYKIFNRYKGRGFKALSDRCRRPVRYANQLPPQMEGLIVSCKREKPHWGARKIRELLVRRLDQDVRIPAKSTIHAVLHRHGLVKGIGRPRHRATGTGSPPA
jgi:transposase